LDSLWESRPWEPSFAHDVLVRTTAALAGTKYADLSTSAAQAIASGGTQGYLRGISAAARAPVRHAAHVSFSAGLHSIFLISAGVALFGALAALALVRSKDSIDS
jgi:hypothetical protein